MISEKEVKHIAKLARLNLTKEEIKKFQKELSSILEYFNFLKEVKVPKEVEPLFHPSENLLPQDKRMRKDKAISQEIKTIKRLREGMQKKEKGYLKIKSIF